MAKIVKVGPNNSRILVVKNGQDIFDVVLQEFGTLDNLGQFITDNGLSINDYISSGQELTINNENTGELRVKNSFEKANFVVMNADEEQLATTIGAFNGDFNNDFGTDLFI